MAKLHKFLVMILHFISFSIFVGCGESTKLNTIFLNFKEIKGKEVDKFQKSKQ